MVRYSFIIPSYNNLCGIKRCIAALLEVSNPSDLSYEILVVDDGSTDGTHEYICSSFPTSVVRCLRLEREPLSSRARARNFGAKSAVGEIINFIDSDIMVSMQHIVQLERFFSYSSEIVVVGNRRFQYPDSVHGSFADDKDSGLDFRYQIYLNQSFNVSAINYPWAVAYTCNFAIPRLSFLDVGGFDEEFLHWGLEDLELGYRCGFNGLRVCFNPYLDVEHLGADSRNELMTKGWRLSGYKKNISYFVHKHSLERLYPHENFHELLINGTSLCQDILASCVRRTIYINESNDYMTVISDINDILFDETSVVILDYCITSNLDIWVQLHPHAGRIFYFPMNIISLADKQILMARLKFGATIKTVC